MSKKAVRKNRLFSLFLFIRDLRNGPVAFNHALPSIGARFWSEEGDADESKGRVISPTTIAEHAACSGRR
jgi:hypothetical protein